MAKVIKTINLSHLDGVKDVLVHKARVEERREGDYSKTGRSTAKEERMEDDIQARRERFGYLF